MFWFQLWREYKLSIAELLAVFPKWKTVYFDKEILILDSIDKEKIIKKSNTLWWTIKIIEITNKSIVNFAENHDWKFNYWLSIFWKKKSLKTELMSIKKDLKSIWINSRFINKDFKPLSSAQIIAEKLVKKWTDFSYIYTDTNQYIWTTIWIQDINAYSKRDYSKDRDMQTGMLPPKLCQIMLNIAWWNSIYDPFVGLGTVLIEWALQWRLNLYWSDLNEKMVELSKSNLLSFVKENNIKLENYDFFKLNSKFINEADIINNWKVESIVTEWYLWEIMTKKNISIVRIEKQRESLKQLYKLFFENLSKTWYNWNLVICFPFWDLRWKYQYFNDIYHIIENYCEVIKLFPNIDDITTNKWSLLYKRDNQLVWREIFKLKIKNNK